MNCCHAGKPILWLCLAAALVLLFLNSGLSHAQQGQCYMTWNEWHQQYRQYRALLELNVDRQLDHYLPNAGIPSAADYANGPVGTVTPDSAVYDPLHQPLATDDLQWWSASFQRWCFSDAEARALHAQFGGGSLKPGYRSLRATIRAMESYWESCFRPRPISVSFRAEAGSVYVNLEQSGSAEMLPVGTHSPEVWARQKDGVRVFYEGTGTTQTSNVRDAGLYQPDYNIHTQDPPPHEVLANLWYSPHTLNQIEFRLGTPCGQQELQQEIMTMVSAATDETVIPWSSDAALVAVYSTFNARPIPPTEWQMPGADAIRPWFTASYEGGRTIAPVWASIEVTLTKGP